MARSLASINSLIGERFGYLVILDSGFVYKKNRKVNVKCDCGTHKAVFLQSLLLGNTVSCGCFRNKNNKILAKKRYFVPDDTSAKNILLSHYKTAARRRNVSWNISNEDFFELTRNNCFYCNKAPSQIQKTKYRSLNYLYNGIDRINNNEGYNKANCVSCCGHCNKAKGIMTVSEFYNWVSSVFQNMEKQK